MSRTLSFNKNCRVTLDNILSWNRNISICDHKNRPTFTRCRAI